MISRCASRERPHSRLRARRRVRDKTGDVDAWRVGKRAVRCPAKRPVLEDVSGGACLNFILCVLTDLKVVQSELSI